MAFTPTQAPAAMKPHFSAATVITLALSISGIIGTYSVLQHRVSVVETQVSDLNTKLGPLATDVAVVKSQVQTTSEAVARIERKLDK